MVISFLLFQQIIMFFIMMAMGAILVLCRLLKSEDSKIVSIIIIYLVLPCVIIHSFQIEFTKEIAFGFTFSVLLSVLVHILFLIFLSFGSILFNYTKVEKATIFYPNAGNMIIPIIAVVLGDEWVIYASAFIAVQLIFLWTHGSKLLSSKKRIQWKKIVLNVNIIAIVLGLTLFLMNIKLPEIIDGTLASVSGLLAPLSMFVAGMIVVKVDFKQVFRDKRVYLICLTRLIVFPGLFLLVIHVLGISNMIENGNLLVFIVFLATITPASSTIIQMAQINGDNASYASALNCVSTLLCSISMPLMVILYNSIYQIF